MQQDVLHLESTAKIVKQNDVKSHSQQHKLRKIKFLFFLAKFHLQKRMIKRRRNIGLSVLALKNI